MRMIIFKNSYSKSNTQIIEYLIYQIFIFFVKQVLLVFLNTMFISTFLMLAFRANNFFFF